MVLLGWVGGVGLPSRAYHLGEPLTGSRGPLPQDPAFSVSIFPPEVPMSKAEETTGLNVPPGLQAWSRTQRASKGR